MIRGREQGFTLIEMVVALAVFSLAAVALLRLQAVAVRTTATLDRTFLAESVARNVVVEALTDARAPALGEAQGMQPSGGRDWRWSRRTAPLGDGRFVRIDVAVADPAGQSLARMTVVRRAGAAL
jgi:general secretion pathway protein I